ncbi:MAG: FAD-dependent monooxygenase [Pseudomonadota bacterium]
MGKAAPRTALVIGAGIGGLCAALCLQRAGFSVRVLERAAQLGDVGAGIQLSPNAMRVLAALGVAPKLADAAVAPSALTMRRGLSGRPVFRLPINDRTHSAAYWHVHRADLIGTLADTLTQANSAAIEFDITVTHCDHDNGVVTTAEGVRHSADIIVGADGIHSTVRDCLFGQDKPQFTGNVAWRMLAPTAAIGKHAPASEATVWVGPGKHAVTYRLRGGAFSNLVGVVETDAWQEESWQAKGSREQALADFQDWHPTIRNIIEHADTHFRWALCERPLLPRWHIKRAVLIGDACHAMLPFMAQGAAMAIEDAWVLAALLQHAHDPRDAFLRFHAVRHGRTSRVQRTARRNGRIFHRRTATSQALTFTPLALIGQMAPTLLSRQTRWLYDKDVVSEHPITLER